MSGTHGENAMNKQLLRIFLLLIFTASGFSGLLYESIWSRYLSLFLGHAAYAQTFVLAMFMGGMSLGSWLSSRFSTRWSHLLRWYAITEGVIGLFGLVFHAAFVAMTDLAYTSIMPALGSPLAAHVIKLTFGMLLILPPSILLGMTFPLMSAGMIRLFPMIPGNSISMLYFTNSLGAAVGVLVSGFVLVGSVGLPGTILTAAMINIAVALIVWYLARDLHDEPVEARVSSESFPRPQGSRYGVLLWVAMLTGLASFVYEIGWIRMLSLVLGSSTHSFEIMLSAFIAGLAFGGLWIRRRIDRIANTVGYLGVVQLVMGLLALSTLVLYGHSFEAMQATIRALGKTEQGYVLFNFASHLMALLIMFPVTFCAGMTLPLITLSLLKKGVGERSIGAVYAANTVGAILGVFAATHLLMPVLGLKGLITFGAGVDLVLGVFLLWTVMEPAKKYIPATAVTVSLVAVAATLAWVHLDSLKMASGVYRYGTLLTSNEARSLFHKDGKTTTVDLIEYKDGIRSITTNGKSDASINVVDEKRPQPDEVTMVLSAVLPLAVHPEAKTVAVIGMGSGLTSHVLLQSDSLRQVDTIEIEQAMVEAAVGFGPRVEAAFSDPRGRIFIEDAKTFFSTHNRKYDIIVSEPSNPWVSGVSSLFSEEFYRLISRHLNDGGVLAQWVQLYEIEPRLVASVLNALSLSFSEYVIFATTDEDMIIIARNGGHGTFLSPGVFENGSLGKELRRHHINTPADLRLRRIGDKKLFQPLFATLGSPPNSDYFPFLDLNAAKSRFLQRSAKELLALRAAPIPVLAILESRADGMADEAAPLDGENVSRGRFFERTKLIDTAESIRDHFVGTNHARVNGRVPPSLQKDVDLVKVRLLDCHGRRLSDVWFHSLYKIAGTVNASLSPRELNRLYKRFESSPCYGSLSESQRTWLSLFKAVGRRDAPRMARLAERLLEERRERQDPRKGYLLAVAMTGQLGQGQPEASLRLWNTYAQAVVGTSEPTLLLRFLYAHSVKSPDA